MVRHHHDTVATEGSIPSSCILDAPWRQCYSDKTMQVRPIGEATSLHGVSIGFDSLSLHTGHFLGSDLGHTDMVEQQSRHAQNVVP